VGVLPSQKVAGLIDGESLSLRRFRFSGWMNPRAEAHSDLRTAVTALGLTYVAGILSNTTVWAPGTGPLPPKAWVPGHGRPEVSRRVHNLARLAANVSR
jgi:hypothetical protein